MIKKIFLVFICILFFIIITQITNKLIGFINGTNYILTFLFGLIVFSYKKESTRLSFAFYVMFLLTFLLFREVTENYSINLDFYLIEWLNIINKNIIVFINITGNIVLFIPLVYFLNNKFGFLQSIAIIITLELLQLLTRRGVFDIVDIVLNFSGVMIGEITRRLHGRKRKKTI